MMSGTAQLLQTLQRWRDAGALRSLDLAFARLLHELDADASPSLLLAAALAAQLEGRGHGCVDLASLPALASELLGWPPALLDELPRLLPTAADAAAWAMSPLIEIDPAGTDGRTPLVLRDRRLYLRRYWNHESRIAAHVRSRTADDDDGAVDGALARLWLDRLFPRARAGRAAKGDADPAIDWQKAACALALHGRLALITGGPGTGKTTTAARLLVLLQALHRGPQPLRVALAAPTGKAAARLRQAIEAALAELRRTLPAPDLFGHDPTAAPVAARTLHALLGARPGTRRLRHDAANPLEVDLLIVDEASMVHLEMMAALLDALPAASRLVLLGDKDQLASVEAGAVMGDLCAGADGGHYRSRTLQRVQALSGIELPQRLAGDGSALAQQTAVLRVSHRFGGPIATLATAVNRGDAGAVEAQLAAAGDGDDVAWARRAHEGDALRALVVDGRGAAAGYRSYLEQLARRPAESDQFEAWAIGVLEAFDRFRVLCAVREGPQGVVGVNALIEQALADARLLPARRGGGIL